MSDDHPKKSPAAPGLNLNTPEMKALLDSIGRHAERIDMMERMSRPDAFNMIMTRGENMPPILKCGHEGRWGFEPFPPGPTPIIPFIHGVQVVTSEHIPPDTMLLISRPDPSRPDWPMLALDPPKDGFKHHAQEWGLLEAVGRQLITQNRGYFNTIILPDNSPIIPERPRVCWTCGQTFMSKRMVGADRQCGPCVTRFKRAQFAQQLGLQREYEIQLDCELRRLGKQRPINLPEPPFKSASQARAAAKQAKARARRRMLRERKRANATRSMPSFNRSGR